MKSRLAIYTSLVFAVVLLLAFVNDDEPLKAIVSKLEKFRSTHRQEKVHLHLDKPFYAVGDDIWFKAYVVDAESNRLSAISNVLNVELINEQDSVQYSVRLPLTSGIGWGDFKLTDSLQEGNYRVRAYTNYMRNFGEEYFFDKAIQVGNAISDNVITSANFRFEAAATDQKVNATINYADLDGKPLAARKVSYTVQLNGKKIARGKAITDEKGDIQINFVDNEPALQRTGWINTVFEMDEKRSIRKSIPVKSTSNQTNVYFFPEGGNQVNGIRSKVAFKAVGADGLGKNISGFVSDGSGEKLVEFKSAHAGMGVFSLLPAAGQTYTATVKFDDGSEKKFALPKAQPEGFVLGVVNTDPVNLIIRISASPSMMAAQGKVTLIAQSNSVVKFVSQADLNNPIFSASVPKNKFSTGILQLTLFNQQNQPVAERLVFINHDDFLKVNVDGPQISAARKKVKMELDVTDPSGKPVFGSFSISVTDAVKVPVDINDESTILNNLLLTSDIKGYVEQPNYYFSSNDDKKVRELDNLMLTQGWRRFTWKNIMAENFQPLTFKAEDGITISGRVTRNRKPVAGGKVMLMSSKERFRVIDTLTDAQGRFVFKDLIFPDSVRFIVQARTAKNQEFVNIELDGLPPQLVTKRKNAADIEVNVNKKLLGYLKNSYDQFEDLRALFNKNVLLDEVRIVRREVRKVKGSANLSNRADAVLTSADFEACTTLDQCLNGKVPGLFVQNGRAFLTRSAHSSLSGPTGMAIYYDGVRISDPDFLSSVNTDNIEGVEVLKGASAAIYGTFGGGGVLIITSKAPGKIAHNAYAAGIITYMPKGYYEAREFYIPDYDKQVTPGRKPDLRTTIFWHPNIIVKNGKASFEYFNSDGRGPYRVNIEGIDGNGKLARYSYKYTVN